MYCFGASSVNPCLDQQDGRKKCGKPIGAHAQVGVIA